MPSFIRNPSSTSSHPENLLYFLFRNMSGAQVRWSPRSYKYESGWFVRMKINIGFWNQIHRYNTVLLVGQMQSRIMAAISIYSWWIHTNKFMLLACWRKNRTNIHYINWMYWENSTVPHYSLSLSPCVLFADRPATTNNLMHEWFGYLFTVLIYDWPATGEPRLRLRRSSVATRCRRTGENKHVKQALSEPFKYNLVKYYLGSVPKAKKHANKQSSTRRNFVNLINIPVLLVACLYSTKCQRS